MPGILPMKVIKCGNALQSRIAQACDRCRSKKIRCDGVTPCCSHCASVGFECKTSDKLSRRAYPRGYTETLEEQVRQLESENRELKGLLDEREEKIDMICKIQSGPVARRLSSSSFANISSDREQSTSGGHQDNEKLSIRIESFPSSSKPQKQDCAGLSNPQALTNAYIHRHASKSHLQPDPSIIFKTPAPRRRQLARHRVDECRLGRVFSDRLINVYFQEIAPLFPMLHQPTILKNYHNFVSATPHGLDVAQRAQLHLIFSVAAVSTQDGQDASNLIHLEDQWATAMVEIEDDVSLEHVQCLTLGALYYLKTRRYPALLRLLGQAVALSSRLGLHSGQDLGETNLIASQCKRKTFWTLFTVDSFAAAHLGTPTLLRPSLATCPLPDDVDDESITSTEITPSLPGASTKISSAIALFILAKTLSRTLDSLYPADKSYDISLSIISNLESELKSWAETLPPHLKLQFEHDKPSTRIISDRSPILSLAYQYIITLVLKPIITARSPPHDRYMSALFGIASASKKTIQILDLLEERSMSVAFAVSRDDMLIHAVFGLLWQCSELKTSGKLLQDSMKLCSEASMKISDERAEAREQLNLCLHANHTAKSSETADCSAVCATLPSRTAICFDESQVVGRKNLQETNQSGSTQSPANSNSDISLQSPDWSTRGARSSFDSIESRCNSSIADLSQPLQQLPRQSRDTLRNSVFEEETHPTGLLKLTNDPRNWQIMLLELDAGRNNIFDGIYGGQYGDPKLSVTAGPKKFNSRLPSHIQTASMNHANTWIGDTAIASTNAIPTTTVDYGNIALSQSNGGNPPGYGPADLNGPIFIPDKSTPASFEEFDIGWIPELDPLCSFSQ